MPELNFNYDANQDNFKLIDLNEFKSKLGMIDYYIFNLKSNEINSQNIEPINNNKNNEFLNSNNYNNFEIINAEEEKLRMEKEDKRNDIIKNFNNDYIIQKLKEENNNSYNNDNVSETNNLGVIQLYKNLENKFDILEKAIEEGKKNKYDFVQEEEKDDELNNNIILTNFSNNIEQEKNIFLEGLYRNEQILQNQKEKKSSKKKKKPLTKISLNNNLKNKKGGNKANNFVDEHKNKKNSKNNLKNKK